MRGDHESLVGVCFKVRGGTCVRTMKLRSGIERRLRTCWEVPLAGAESTRLAKKLISGLTFVTT
jgi:hypothetical protein